MKTLNMALCANRHDIPQATDGYIFREIKNITDTYLLESEAFCSLWTQCRLKEWLKYASSVFPDVKNTKKEDWRTIPPNKIHLNLYVTGLTVALIAVLNVCKDEKIGVTLYHYDRSTGDYFTQEVR